MMKVTLYFYTIYIISIPSNRAMELRGLYLADTKCKLVFLSQSLISCLR